MMYLLRVTPHLCQEDAGRGDGGRRAGGVRGLLHPHQRHPHGSLRRAVRSRRRRVLPGLPALHVCGQRQLLPGSSTLLLWLLAVPEEGGGAARV